MFHLLHPAVVHFSIAFLVTGGLLEAAALLAGNRRVASFGGTLVVIGTASVVLTLITGYLAANTLDIPEAAREVFDAHERNGWLVLGLFGLALFWKALCRGKLEGIQARLYALYLVAGVALVVYSAYLGAELVYDYGVGVGVG